MSDLTRFRDHARKMAAHGVLPISADDRALWTRLADEVDAYLARDQADTVERLPGLPVIDDDQLNLLETP